MKKLILVLLAVAVCLAFSIKADSQDSQYRTIVLSGTADLLVDSSLTSAYMGGVRAYINGIYWWYDNGANTNQIFVEVVRGQSAFVTQGLRRQFKYSEAMTSSGIKGTFMPMNVTTGTDSTLYFIINAASSDSLFMAVNFKLVN